MSSKDAQEESDFDNEDLEKATKELRSEKSSSNFEKNYPKNIFIPIIEYLADIGLKNEYEECVGTREQFEGKNVVSLTLIFQLLTQQWFQTRVNKTLLEANISNKIMQNSKIKKKLFHIKVAHVLLNSQTDNAKTYKKNVSRGANKIANQIQEDDELFEHPSSIIYLLNLFLSTLQQFSRQSNETNQDSDQSSLINKQTNSKQEYKSLIKSTILGFNRIKSSKQTLQMMKVKIGAKIESRAKQINSKYQLNENVPCWEGFQDCVIEKCFESKILGHKITNSIFNQWICDFKQRSSHIGLQPENFRMALPSFKTFTPIIVILPQQE